MSTRVISFLAAIAAGLSFSTPTSAYELAPGPIVNPDGRLQMMMGATYNSRRDEYLQMGNCVRHFAVVDATRSEDEVASDVSRLIVDFFQRGNVRA